MHLSIVCPASTGWGEGVRGGFGYKTVMVVSRVAGWGFRFENVETWV